MKKIMIEIPNEFENDLKDKFQDFFERIKVEIVTCKDCKHNGTMYCKCFMCDGNEYMSYHNPNFYCADAERRE